MGYKTRGKRNSEQKKRLKARLLKKYGNKCHICKLPLNGNITIDHIKRLRDGGTWHINNLRLAHYNCNKLRD